MSNSNGIYYVHKYVSYYAQWASKEKNRATSTNTSSILFLLLRGPLCLRIINFSPFKYPLILASEERSFEGFHKLLFFLNLARSAIKENHK